MKMKATFQYTIGIAVLIGLFVFLAGCGSDEAAPSIDTSSIPQTVFFNETGNPEFFLFRGRATDNTNVETVLVSGDNGATFTTAVLDKNPPNANFNVEWFLLVSSNDLSAGMHTVLVKASDRDGNESTSDPVIVNVSTGSTINSLLAVFSGATPGDAIGLSTGEGFGYGDSTANLTIPIGVPLTIMGSGFGDGPTSGGFVPDTGAIAGSVATILETGSATSPLFSVDADLTLEAMRLLGGANGVRVVDSVGSDPQLSVEDSLFDKQKAWAVFARDDDQMVSVEFISSIVDASLADSPSGGGGLFLDNLNYTVVDSQFYLHSAVAPGAGVQATGGAGNIDNSIFGGNALAIWASGGFPVINSCNISGAAFTTNGINLTGGPGSAVIRRNTIDGNTGGYGLRVGGEMGLTLRNNAITNNGMSGVLIDSTLGNTSLGNIDMGTTNDRGNNEFNDNNHPSIPTREIQVYVTQATSAGPTLIPANWNFWGVATAAEVNLSHIDNGDEGGLRATLAIGSFWPSPGGEVGP